MAVRLAHVVPHLDEEAAGPTQSVLRLCESLALEGEQVDLHTMAAGRPPKGVHLMAYKEWAVLGRFGFSPEIVRACAKASRSMDVVHNHSLWSFPNMAAGLTTRRAGATLVTSPRGTLAPAARARSSFKKAVFKPLQWPAISRAACLHATSRMEYEDIRRAGLRHPVAVIPNGIDVPDPGDDVRGQRANASARALFLGRLHPIKGIEMLLEAWRALQDAHPRWELVIVGKGESAYVKGLQRMAADLGLQRVSFSGPAYGAEKGGLLRSSDLFVLPTKTENFGMAIAEALAQGLPVVTTRGAPWSGLVSQRCGWWVERTHEDLLAGLDEAMRLEPRALREMGRRGRQWMISEFDWRSIAKRTKAVYQWLRHGGEAPSWVMLD